MMGRNAPPGPNDRCPICYSFVHKNLIEAHVNRHLDVEDSLRQNAANIPDASNIDQYGSQFPSQRGCTNDPLLRTNSSSSLPVGQEFDVAFENKDLDNSEVHNDSVVILDDVDLVEDQTTLWNDLDDADLQRAIKLSMEQKDLSPDIIYDDDNDALSFRQDTSSMVDDVDPCLPRFSRRTASGTCSKSVDQAQQAITQNIEQLAMTPKHLQKRAKNESSKGLTDILSNNTGMASKKSPDTTPTSNEIALFRIRQIADEAKRSNFESTSGNLLKTSPTTSCVAKSLHSFVPDSSLGITSEVARTFTPISRSSSFERDVAMALGCNLMENEKFFNSEEIGIEQPPHNMIRSLSDADLAVVEAKDSIRATNGHRERKSRPQHRRKIHEAFRSKSGSISRHRGMPLKKIQRLLDLKQRRPRRQKSSSRIENEDDVQNFLRYSDVTDSHGQTSNSQKSIDHFNKPRKPYSTLRPVVLDGSNIAFQHSRGAGFSIRGIVLACKEFINRGHRVACFVPERLRYQRYDINPHRMIKDQYLLPLLEELGLLFFTPSRPKIAGLHEKPFNAYDDYTIVEYAHRTGGVIVSKDYYRDVASVHPEWTETIQKRHLMFSWVEDLFMLPKDPMGRTGPYLEEFLTFGPNDTWPDGVQVMTDEMRHNLLNSIGDILKNPAPPPEEYQPKRRYLGRRMNNFNRNGFDNLKNGFNSSSFDTTPSISNCASFTGGFSTVDCKDMTDPDIRRNSHNSNININSNVRAPAQEISYSSSRRLYNYDSQEHLDSFPCSSTDQTQRLSDRNSNSHVARNTATNAAPSSTLSQVEARNKAFMTLNAVFPRHLIAKVMRQNQQLVDIDTLSNLIADLQQNEDKDEELR